jgi:hypothetical protein
VVRPGDCLSLIARAHGCGDYRTIYNHAENAALRKIRPDPNILHPGDIVVIPDRDDKSVSCPGGQAHRFQVALPRRHLRLQLENRRGEAMSNKPCVVRIAGVDHNLVTGSDGLIEIEIRDETEVTLIFDGLERVIAVGQLNPMRDADDDGVSGVQARLRNLGYHPEEVDGSMAPHTAAAIRAFQQAHRLSPTGKIDSALLDKLNERHRC